MLPYRLHRDKCYLQVEINLLSYILGNRQAKKTCRFLNYIEAGMDFTREQAAQMMDFSAVQAQSDMQDIQLMVDKAIEYKPIAVFALPGWTSLLKEKLRDHPEIAIGGVVGFPSGGDTTESKIFQADELIKAGCSELDMVINIGKLRSQLYDEVEQDISAVVRAAKGKPVKVIFECTHLSDEQIRRACRLCIDAGASYVKTGTGWTDCTRIADYISIMKSCVGDRIKIKAAGGIRDLDTFVDLYNRGARRFGVGAKSAITILQAME